MKKLFFSIALVAVLLFSFGCGERKAKELSPEAKAALKEVTDATMKRVKTDEVDLHIDDTIALVDKYSVEFPEVSRD